ncbi:MAG: hypothetical protein AB7O43_16870 [Hyphomicrobiaceae bacterium]
MKALMTLLACALAFTFTAAAEAKQPRKKKVYRDYNAGENYRHARRPYSIGPNGLCQRDTGTPTSQLNFRVKCDVEEFWRRMEDNAGGFR